MIEQASTLKKRTVIVIARYKLRSKLCKTEKLNNLRSSWDDVIFAEYNLLHECKVTQQPLITL